ncbi:MAG: sigma-70 family RNA polymerase sigma factor [Planctomycetes bacterium]|nr:sigma-70 family RNA polymerase sigma factor [Planctomycetota bacterium]
MDSHPHCFPARNEITARLHAIADLVTDARLTEACAVLEERPYEESRDLVNTRLMEVFKDSGSTDAFSLLYELNQQGFLFAIQNRIRSYRGMLDAGDVLQEVFFNIYRYPHKFNGEKPEAFRHWANTIIRNTVLKHLRASGRPVRFEFLGEELAERRDERADNPLRDSMETEAGEEVRRAYMITLSMYLDAYTELSGREQKALQLVEVEGLCYRDASSVLGIRVENLKMLIFRARRKMYRCMRRRFASAGVTSAMAV